MNPLDTERGLLHTNSSALYALAALGLCSHFWWEYVWGDKKDPYCNTLWYDLFLLFQYTDTCVLIYIQSWIERGAPSRQKCCHNLMWKDNQKCILPDNYNTTLISPLKCSGKQMWDDGNVSSPQAVAVFWMVIQNTSGRTCYSCQFLSHLVNIWRFTSLWI